MNFEKTKFSQELRNLALIHPIAKWVYNYINTENQPELMGTIERLINLLIKQEEELLEIKTNGLKYNIPKIELSFNEAPEEIKRQMRTTMFDIKYQGYRDQYGTWSDISEREYIQGAKSFRDSRIIYIEKLKT